MIIIEDSREGLPLNFTDERVDFVIRNKLEYGDYSAHSNGVECPTFFERKSIVDLFGTLGKDHDRFRKEIDRCTGDGNKLIIIIEGSYKNILKGCKHSKIKGISIIKTLFTLVEKYNVSFVPTDSRVEMEHYIIEYFSAWERNMNNG